SVSRRHAALRVGATSVTLRDLGSRNGVRVNGKLAEPDQLLRHLDKISIGNQEILFVDVDQGVARRSASAEVCSACGATNAAAAATCVSCGAPLDAKGLDGQTVELRLGTTADDVVKSENAFLLVAGIAEKTIAMKSFEKAEQMLAPHLDMMVFRTQREEVYSPAAVERAIGFALRLAEGRNARRWLQWVFILHIAGKRVMDAATIDRLHDVVRKVRYDDPRPLRDYLTTLAGIEDRLTPADRFLVKRLEALHRVIAA
ncbi:MAG: FHA domain-containing protein, partial [Polyangiaceae bacterium]|nr:FHA domain-containing protein [Polyangiaceae bacterium]